MSFPTTVLLGTRTEIEPSECARRPGEKTDGIVGKTLEDQVSADIKLFKEGYGTGDEAADMHVEET